MEKRFKRRSSGTHTAVVVGLALSASLLGGLGCGTTDDAPAQAEAAVVMPDVVGTTLDVARSTVTDAGVEEIETVGGGAAEVAEESEWTVCRQQPAAGSEAPATATLTVDRRCLTPQQRAAIRRAAAQKRARAEAHAKARARARAHARAVARAAARAERVAAEAKRAAAEAAAIPEPAPEPAPVESAPDYSGMNCTEIGHSFNVAPGSDPDHDADNDGVACESF